MCEYKCKISLFCVALDASASFLYLNVIVDANQSELSVNVSGVSLISLIMTAIVLLIVLELLSD